MTTAEAKYCVRRSIIFPAKSGTCDESVLYQRPALPCDDYLMKRIHKLNSNMPHMMSLRQEHAEYLQRLTHNHPIWTARGSTTTDPSKTSQDKLVMLKSQPQSSQQQQSPSQQQLKVSSENSLHSSMFDN